MTTNSISFNFRLPSTAKVQQRDNDFYFQDVTLLVEGRLFKVPARNFITESEVFETVFKLPQKPDVAANGLSDDKPLGIEGVKCDDFRQLLRVMYPSGIESETLTVEEWLSVLGLAIQMSMPRIRALAIKNVRVALAPDDLHPHKLLSLGQTYNVDEWVIAAIVAYIERKEPIGLDDVETIGIETALKIASLRECVPNCKKRRRDTDMKKIKQVFGIPVETDQS